MEVKLTFLKRVVDGIDGGGYLGVKLDGDVQSIDLALKTLRAAFGPEGE